MHTKETINKIYELWRLNKNASEIARDLSISRSTIRDYIKKFKLLTEGTYPNWHRGLTQNQLFCGFESHRAYQYSYLLGMYLGDGHITESKKLKNGSIVYRLRIFCDAKYPNIIERIRNAIEVTVPNSKALTIKKHDGNCIIVYAYSTDFGLLFPQHGKGMKHERKIQLEDFQKQNLHYKPFIRGLLESDGCRYQNVIGKRSYTNYSFSNRSNDIHEIFSWACDQLGIKTRRTGYNTVISTRKSVELVDSFVGPKS